jgi:hypothetical protein
MAVLENGVDVDGEPRAAGVALAEPVAGAALLVLDALEFADAFNGTALA